MMNRRDYTYYIPLTTLCKVALRIEKFFLTIHEACYSNDKNVHRYALLCLIELAKIAVKPELKSRFLKEFIRIEHTLNKSNVNLCEETHACIHKSIATLTETISGFTTRLGQDPFIQSIGFSGASSNTDIDFSLPQLQYWLSSTTNDIKQSFSHWESLIFPLKNICHNFLAIVKESALYEEICVHQGIYQCSFPVGSTCHMVIITCVNTVIPQTQMGHNRLNISIHHPATMHKIMSGNNTIQLGLCTM